MKISRSIWSALVALIVAAVPAGADEKSPAVVRMVDSGMRVTLDNGIVAAELNKADGNILALRYRGASLLAEPTYLDWHSNAKNHLKGSAFKVVTDPATNRGEMAEVAILEKSQGEASPFEVELHFVLRQGESGLYCFAVFRHRAGDPAGGLGPVRQVFRLDERLFDTIHLDDARQRVFPPTDTPYKVLGPKESMMMTEGPFKGFVADKYHCFVDAGDHFVHGWTGEKSGLGCWVLYGSTEDMNGGPTKQHNTTHWGRILFKILSCGHYGASDIDVAKSESWEKFFGPWLIYLNSGGDGAQLWADAKARAAAERAAWPLAWLRHPAYPLADARGGVAGRLLVNDPQDRTASAAGAWVGLAAPSPDWQQQANNYQYWTRAGADGSFSIKGVRPGSYTLYAFVDGVIGEFRRDSMTVAAGSTNQLPELAWEPKRFGRQLWQLGRPDRTAAEFRHGDDHRQWGLWLKYPKEFPQGVNFAIGQSRERTDWNYAQVNVLKNGTWTGTKWRLLFDLPDAPARGVATLRLALASAQKANLRVAINGTLADIFGTGADNAMTRAGIHGQYSQRDIPFDARLLKAGRNELTFEQRAGNSSQKSVMYDCLRMELDESRAFEVAKDKPVWVTKPSSAVQRSEE